MTVEKCVEMCAGKKYSFAGVQYAYKCYCGNSLPPVKKEDSECNMNCLGNLKQKCGGSMRNSVYETSDKKVEDETSVMKDEEEKTENKEQRNNAESDAPKSSVEAKDVIKLSKEGNQEEAARFFYGLTVVEKQEVLLSPDIDAFHAEMLLDSDVDGKNIEIINDKIIEKMERACDNLCQKEKKKGLAELENLNKKSLDLFEKKNNEMDKNIAKVDEAFGKIQELAGMGANLMKAFEDIEKNKNQNNVKYQSPEELKKSLYGKVQHIETQSCLFQQKQQFTFLSLGELVLKT